MKLNHHISELYLSGESSASIAKKYEVSPNTILRFLKINNIKRRRGKFLDLDSKIQKDICSEFLSGQKIKKLSKKFKISENGIRRVLFNNKISLRKNKVEVRTYKILEDYFKEIDSHTKAYILGLIFADGNINRQIRICKIALTGDDELKLLNNIKNQIYINRPDILKNKKSNTLSICNKSLCEDLLNLGVVPNKSLILKFPKINSIYYGSFILGYFDGDGCIYVRENKYPNISIVGTESFLKSVKKILESYGIYSSYYQFQHSKAFYLTFAERESVKRFYNFIYKHVDFCLERKRKKFEKLLDFWDKSSIKKPMSEYVGVSFDKQRNKWTAKISINNKCINIGRYDTERDALIARENYEKNNTITNRHRRYKNFGSRAIQ